ncbi:MAG: CRISPR-associated endoribonuclease Cas6 [Bacteroidota bacterium]
MRVYLQLSRNTAPVPFNYQQKLTGAFHKWLGTNELHDDISLYSLSWLRHVGRPCYKTTKAGLVFPYGAEFFISSPLQDLHTKAVQGIFEDAEINWGMRVEEVRLRRTPDFGQRHRFLAQSPILIKRKRLEDQHAQYFFPSHAESDAFLTETLQSKLRRLQLPTDVSVAFDRSYPRPHIKKISYHGIDIKATLCPVIVEGDPQAVAAAWDCGIGNSTGIGFGALV